MQGEQKNVWIAMAIIVVMFFGWQVFYELPKVREQQEREVSQADIAAQQQEQAADAVLPSTDGTVPEVATVQEVQAGSMTREQALQGSPRIRISTPALHGSIALNGARLDDLTLVRYHTTVEENSPEVVLLSPPGAQYAYFVDFGLLAQDEAVAVPGADALWESTGGSNLAAGQPVTLTWDNGAGLVFHRTIAVDENYMFTVTQTVANTTGQDVTLLPYGLVGRHGVPPHQGQTFTLNEGPIGVFSDTIDSATPADIDYRLKELDYADLLDEPDPEDTGGMSQGGWLGFTDKFWLTALIPEQNETYKWSFFAKDRGTQAALYQADYLRPAITVPAGGEASVTDRLFAGAQVVSLLENYEDDGGVPFFGRLVFSRADYIGGFYFITEPMFQALEFFKNLLGNFGLAILALTLCIKLLFFPLANKSYKAMSKMRNLAPEMQKMRERYKDDKAKQQQELMALYRKEKVNPAAGCLPILVQIPVFIALYQVLISTIEMRHAPFYGWIEDLSVPDPTSIWNLFGLLPFSTDALPAMMATGFLAIGIWPILMAGTMFLQQRISPQPPDPIQAKVFMFMPLIFLFLFATFPAGLVIYWTWNNLLSISQQWFIMKRTEKKKT
ncbi:MAG: membrane protein insertase YidC [Proteobacteria bacterium]|nr:membrane protein insertase YidC [Pseudomonadota bacterium]